MSLKDFEEIQKLNQEKTCWNCIFCEDDCCMYECKTYAILDGNKLSKDCEHYINLYNNKGDMCDFCKKC